MGLGARVDHVLATMRRRHPGVTLQVSTAPSTTRQLAAVAAGDLDAAFVAAPPDTPGVQAHHVWDEPLLAAVPAAHAATAGDLTTLADLPLARSTREDNPGTHDLITGACREAGFTPRPGPLLTRAQDTLAGPVAAGDCWTLLPADLVHPGSTAVALVEPDPPILAPITLALPDPLRRVPAANLLDIATRPGRCGNPGNTAQ